jgi:hypothetical protein
MNQVFLRDNTRVSAQDAAVICNRGGNPDDSDSARAQGHLRRIALWAVLQLVASTTQGGTRPF